MIFDHRLLPTARRTTGHRVMYAPQNELLRLAVQQRMAALQQQLAARFPQGPHRQLPLPPVGRPLPPMRPYGRR